MSTKIGRELKRRFAVPYGCYKLVATRRSFLRESGWIESIRTSTPCDSVRQPIPWMNYSVVEFLSDRLAKWHDVFEFGSGYSTCYFAEKCKSVFSVEYDKAWFDRVEDIVPENAHMFYEPYDEDGQYCRTIHTCDQRFQLVVVDGQDRVNCILQSIEQLADDGILLLDDSDRPGYRRGVDALADAGFRSLSIAGIKPGSPCRHQTTIFYRNDNCFGL